MLLRMHDEQSFPHGNMAMRAHSLLSSAQHPLEAATLIEHLFRIKKPNPYARSTGVKDFWSGQLVLVLADESIFAQYADGSWGLREWGQEDVPLDRIEYIVVDCETTGLDPNIQRVIEIAALRCRGTQVVDRYVTFVDPERYIPQAIRQLTGITPEHLRGAPHSAEAIAEFLEFAGGMLLVGHNVRFDLGFLGAEALRHRNTRLLNPSICTIRLAGRLLPQLRRPNLDNLARALDLTTHDRHRAQGDAEVTQQAFCKLVELARERGVHTVGRLQALVGPASGSVKAVGKGTGRLLLDPALRKGLPERPGVYLMKDESGTIIYVGKAKNLKQRIASYYSHPLGYRRKMDGLLESVRDLQTVVVGSELQALILESKLIKAHEPKYNVQLKHYRHYPFIKVDVASPFPRVQAVREVRDDGGRYFGPFRSKQSVDTIVDLIPKMFPIRTCTRVINVEGKHRGKSSGCLRFHLGLCLGPCIGTVTPDEYRLVIDEVLTFLGGGKTIMLDRIERAMLRASELESYEKAASLRDALRQARQVLLSQELLTGAVDRHNLVIVCPGVDPGSVELFGIRHGRLYEQHPIACPDDPEVVEGLAAFLARLHAAAEAPPVVGQAEIDAIIIIGRWLERFEDSPQVVRLPDSPSEQTVSTVLAAARAIHAQPIAEQRDDHDEDWDQ